MHRTDARANDERGHFPQLSTAEKRCNIDWFQLELWVKFIQNPLAISTSCWGCSSSNLSPSGEPIRNRPGGIHTKTCSTPPGGELEFPNLVNIVHGSQFYRMMSDCIMEENQLHLSA